MAMQLRTSNTNSPMTHVRSDARSRRTSCTNRDRKVASPPEAVSPFLKEAMAPDPRLPCTRHIYATTRMSGDLTRLAESSSNVSPESVPDLVAHSEGRLCDLVNGTSKLNRQYGCDRRHRVNTTQLYQRQEDQEMNITSTRHSIKSRCVTDNYKTVLRPLWLC
jgi:hypothetical protein